MWPENPPTSLNVLADRLSDTQVRILLEELDCACYGGDSLARDFDKTTRTRKMAKVKSALEDLYQN